MILAFKAPQFSFLFSLPLFLLFPLSLLPHQPFGIFPFFSVSLLSFSSQVWLALNFSLVQAIDYFVDSLSHPYLAHLVYCKLYKSIDKDGQFSLTSFSLWKLTCPTSIAGVFFKFDHIV